MLLHLCQSLQHISWIVTISKSPDMISTVWLFHYLGMFLLVGTTVIVDLRVLGIAGRGPSIAELGTDPGNPASGQDGGFAGNIALGVGRHRRRLDPQRRLALWEGSKKLQMSRVVAGSFAISPLSNSVSAGNLKEGKS